TYLEEYIEGQAPPVVLPIGKAKALYAYAGLSPEELSVEAGDEVEIMEKPDPLWWRARNAQGSSGMLPATYLEELEGQSTSAAGVIDSDTSDYASAEEGDDSDDDVDTETETSSSSSSDDDDDEDDLDNNTTSSSAAIPIAQSVSLTPAIAIARAPRHRAPPPRPTSKAPLALSSSLSTSAPSRPNVLLRKQSEGSLSSHLTIPTEPLPGMRQRSGSHSSAMPIQRTAAHPRFVSENISAYATRSPSPTPMSGGSWSSTVGLEISQSLTEKERKRQEAIHELITTEQVYLSYLYLVRDSFQRPLLDQGLISPSESQSLFMEWSSLLELSQSIVDELVQRQVNDEGGNMVLAVGDVINSHIVERAGCFMRYCANHRVASNLLAKRMSESRLLLDFLTQAKSKPECRGLDISSFLLQPLQRITRYPLLIKKILQYTDEDQTDHLLLSEALISAEQFLGRINETIRNSESRVRLEEIQRKLPAGDLSEGLNLLSETKYLGPRQVLHEGAIRKAKSGRKLYGYLCNDLLLLFVPGRSLGSLTKSASHTSLSATSPSLGSSDRGSFGNGGSQAGAAAGGGDGHSWTLYSAPIPLERVKVRIDSGGDDLKFTIIVTTPVTTSHASHNPLHLQPHQNHNVAHQIPIHIKAGSAKERRAW
ncbi:Intersectin 1 (SH3 domain protein), partial [Dissophora globulifera]